MYSSEVDAFMVETGKYAAPEVEGIGSTFEGVTCGESSFAGGRSAGSTFEGVTCCESSFAGGRSAGSSFGVARSGSSKLPPLDSVHIQLYFEVDRFFLGRYFSEATVPLH